MDIKSAFLLAEGVSREIYMKKPRARERSKKTYWRFKRAAYGLVIVPRLWKLSIDNWLYRKGFKSIP